MRLDAMRMGKGRQRYVEFACTWSYERENSANGDQKEDKSFRLTDKPLIALYIALDCLDS